jgi:hypothetical protein
MDDRPRITVILRHEDNAALMKIAKQTRIPRATLVQVAIGEYLDRQKNKEV